MKFCYDNTVFGMRRLDVILFVIIPTMLSAYLLHRNQCCNFMRRQRVEWITEFVTAHHILFLTCFFMMACLLSMSECVCFLSRLNFHFITPTHVNACFSVNICVVYYVMCVVSSDGFTEINVVIVIRRQ